MSPDALCDEFVRDLAGDAVTCWADEVSEAVAAARRGCAAPASILEDPLEQKRRAIRQRIARLEEQLRELEVTQAGDASSA